MFSELVISAQLSAADGFVIAMLAMMTLSLGVIGALVLSMRRNEARRDREVERLLEEVAEAEKEETPTPLPAKAPEREPWEKDGDWWKS